MKLFFASLFIMAISFNIAAQSKAVDIKDPKAKAILDKISSQLEAYKTVEMDFEFNIEFPGQKAEIQKGKIIQAGDKYFVEMQMQSIYSDGESLWIHLKNNNEVQWNNAEEATAGGFMDPTSLINMYKTGEYAYAITNEAKEENETIQQIEFKPLDDSSPFSKMRLTLVKGKNEVKRMKVFSKDGSNYTMNISDIKSNKEYAAETFVFDKSKFPGVHVEDLRMD